MTRLLSKRTAIFGICCSLTMFALESQSAPIRVGIVRSARMNPRQRASTRLQTNRALRQLMRASPRALMASSLSGPNGASGISAAAMNPGSDQANSSAMSTTTALPTLHDVWASLASTMRFANQLKPDPNTGVLPNSALLTELLYRRTINQARFDANHPQIARLLDWDSVIRANSVPSGPRPGITNSQVVVPEPSSVLIGLGFIGFAALHRARTRKQA